jgi:hypothetical protein
MTSLLYFFDTQLNGALVVTFCSTWKLCASYMIRFCKVV